MGVPQEVGSLAPAAGARGRQQHQEEHSYHYHYRDDAQPEVGVKVAAAQALRKAIVRASPVRLEPLMSLEVAVPEEHLGAIIGDLQQRHAQVKQIDQRGEMRIVDALAPLRLMFGYANDLRSMSRGRASFSMRFHAYDALG